MTDYSKNSHLFPKLDKTPTKERMNEYARQKADAEERAHMKYLEELNRENREKRTGANKQ